jgi:hypothetical protein
MATITLQVVAGQELADDIGILDKACRQCGAELAQGGLAALDAHAVAVNAMLAKWGRLQAAKAAQTDAQASLHHLT